MRDMYFILFTLFLISCSSCNNSNVNTVSEMDTEMQDSKTDNSLYIDIDDKDNIVTIDSISPDIDNYIEESEFPDMYNDPYGTFYPDSEQHIAYTYYGDYPDQNAQDPEGVRKLWDSFYMSSSKTIDCTPTSFDACFSHYPFEPQMINGEGWCGIKKNTDIGTFQCDAILTPGCWDGDNLSPQLKLTETDGKLLFYIRNSSLDPSFQSSGTFTYDIESRHVLKYGRALMSGWQNKRYIFISTLDYSSNYKNKNEPDYRPYEYLVYYDTKEKKYGYAWKMKDSSSPIDSITDFRASDTHLFMTAFFKTGEDSYDARIMFTKIGEWEKWKEITYKKEILSDLDRRAVHPSMIDNYVTYYDVQLQAHVCDLTKEDGGCFRVSKENEYARYPILKDSNTVLYVVDRMNSVDHVDQVIQADVTDKNNIKYEKILEHSDPIIIKEVDNNYINYIVMKNYDLGENVYQGDICYYRFEDNKTFCLDTEIDKKLPIKHSVIYKHMLVFTAEYNYIADIVVRDMECYCDFYPDKCPFSDYTPNPESPKDPWK